MGFFGPSREQTLQQLRESLVIDNSRFSPPSWAADRNPIVGHFAAIKSSSTPIVIDCNPPTAEKARIDYRIECKAYKLQSVMFWIQSRKERLEFSDVNMTTASVLDANGMRHKNILVAHFEVKLHHYSFALPRDREEFTLFPSGAPERKGREQVQGIVDPPRPATFDDEEISDRLMWLLSPPIHEVLSDPCLALPEDPRPFQKLGIKWLMDRDACLLADEMGLGKTMQSIIAARLLWRERKLKQVLVVCPKPLISNWRTELGKWWPGVLRNTRVTDDNRRRFLQLGFDSIIFKIINYEALACELDWLVKIAVHHDLIILDEAQRIKNASSKTAQAVNALKAKRRWALTGTPIENSIADLVSIFGFVAPGVVKSTDSLDTIKRLVRPYILRRKQEDVVKELPEKSEQDVEVELRTRQRSAYDKAEKSGIVDLKAKGETLRITHVFQLISRLRQICNFDPVSGESAKADLLCDELAEIAESGRKALIFSQFVDAQVGLKRLKAAIEASSSLGGHGKATLYTGEVAGGQREQVLREFRENSAHRALLVNYKIGSVGLNMQCANYVFLFDRWWNPAVEDQAVKRIHRIGQQHKVFAKKFYCRGTIEERILKALARKRRIFSEVIDDDNPDAMAMGMSEEEVFALFDLKVPSKRHTTERARKLPRLRLANIDDRQFEDLVAEVYEREGFRVIQGPRTRDGGIDIIAEKASAGGTDRIVIQCKHQRKPVGRPVLQQLWGVLDEDKRNTRADLVTSGAFSTDAIAYAAGKRIVLVDGENLAKRAKSLGVAEFVEEL